MEVVLSAMDPGNEHSAKSGRQVVVFESRAADQGVDRAAASNYAVI